MEEGAEDTLKRRKQFLTASSVYALMRFDLLFELLKGFESLQRFKAKTALPRKAGGRKLFGREKVLGVRGRYTKESQTLRPPIFACEAALNTEPPAGQASSDRCLSCEVHVLNQERTKRGGWVLAWSMPGHSSELVLP